MGFRCLVFVLRIPSVAMCVGSLSFVCHVCGTCCCFATARDNCASLQDCRLSSVVGFLLLGFLVSLGFSAEMFAVSLASGC